MVRMGGLPDGNVIDHTIAFMQGYERHIATVRHTQNKATQEEFEPLRKFQDPINLALLIIRDLAIGREIKVE